MTIPERIHLSGPKRILALDGGGIRGILTIEVLAKLEALLRQARGNDSKFVLADYFDLVAGTSTGAILAACIALGKPVSDIRQFYVSSGADMFDKAGFLTRQAYYKYEDQKLAAQLQAVFGATTTLGSDQIRTVLMMVMRNVTTDSPWPVSNNPFAKYNRHGRRLPPHEDCNLDLPLWQLVRASTAAPTYFPPEKVRLGTKDFIFVDGGVTPYNNPAFQAFLMATVEPYQMNWRTGERDLLVVSVGTGTSPEADANLDTGDMHVLYQAKTIPSALMFAALNEQDFLCRAFGKCVAGDPLDREVGDMIGKAGPVSPKLFTYARYNAELTRAGLDALGLKAIEPKDVQQLDSVDHIPELQQVGQAVASKVKPEHFAGFA